jgi:26S proteasome regulatory subunit T2
VIHTDPRVRPSARTSVQEKDQEERAKVEDLRGSPLAVGNLEEMIDDNHAIVSSSVGPEYYVGVLSFVNQDLLEPGCTVLLHNKVRYMDGWMDGWMDRRRNANIDVYAPRLWSFIHSLPPCTYGTDTQVMAVVGILSDDTDPMVSVMKVEKAPLESYADIGGLETQIQVRSFYLTFLTKPFAVCRVVFDLVISS